MGSTWALFLNPYSQGNIYQFLPPGGRWGHVSGYLSLQGYWDIRPGASISPAAPPLKHFFTAFFSSLRDPRRDFKMLTVEKLICTTGFGSIFIDMSKNLREPPRTHSDGHHMHSFQARCPKMGIHGHLHSIHPWYEYCWPTYKSRSHPDLLLVQKLIFFYVSYLYFFPVGLLYIE